MKIDDLKSVSHHLTVRENAVKLMEAAAQGGLAGFQVIQYGKSFDVMAIVSSEQIRQAIIESCDDLIRATDKTLNSLGVTTPKLVEQPETLEEWKRTAEMYVRCWIRELGGTLKPKSHLIDALCITTSDMRALAEKHSGPVVSKEHHDARVKDLLEANNRYQQEARDARRELAEYRALSPTDRLAADVHRAVTDVITKFQSS